MIVDRAFLSSVLQNVIGVSLKARGKSGRVEKSSFIFHLGERELVFSIAAGEPAAQDSNSLRKPSRLLSRPQSIFETWFTWISKPSPA